MSTGTQNVNEFLSRIIGKQVMIKLNSGIEYKGSSFFRKHSDENIRFIPFS
jgi:hypothetical protein